MRFVKAFWFTVLLALPVSVYAAGHCADEYADCHDTCIVSYGGSIQEKVKAKLVKCVARCQRTANNCRELAKETKVNQLDETALEKKKLNEKESDELTPESKPEPEKPRAKKSLDDDDLRNH